MEKKNIIMHVDIMRISIAIILLVVFLDATIFSTRYRNSIIVIAVFGGIAAIRVIIKSRAAVYSKSSLKHSLLLFFMAIVVFYNNADIKNRAYKYEVLFVVLFVLFLGRAYYSDLYMHIYTTFINYFGLLATATTIFFYYSPGVYTTFVLPRAPKAYYAGLLYCFQHGYQAGIALHYSTNAIFLTLYIGFAFAKIISKQYRKWDIIFFALGCVALLLTAKRAHIIFSLFAMYYTYYIFNKKSGINKVFKSVGVVISVLVAFSIIGQVAPQLLMVKDRIGYLFTGDDLWGNRLTFYKLAVSLFKRRPLVGNGWGSYKYYAEKMIGVINEAHNVFLQLLAETGLIGSVICMLSLTMMFIPMVKIIGQKDNNADHYQICCCFFAFFFVLYCITGNPLYDNQMLMPMMLMSSYSVHKLEANYKKG